MSPDSRGAPPPPSGVLLEQFFHLELQRQRHTSSPHMNDRKTPKIIKIASRIRPWLQIWWPPLTTAPLGERTVAGEGGSGGLVRPGSAGGEHHGGGLCEREEHGKEPWQQTSHMAGPERGGVEEAGSCRDSAARCKRGRAGSPRHGARWGALRRICLEEGGGGARAGVLRRFAGGVKWRGHWPGKMEMARVAVGSGHGLQTRAH